MKKMFFIFSLFLTCASFSAKADSFQSAKTLYASGLFHSAFRAFDAILANPNERAEVKTAAAEYVRVMEVEHPHFKLSTSAVSGLLRAPNLNVTSIHRLLLTLLARGQLDPYQYPKSLLAHPEDLAAARLVAAMVAVQHNPKPASLPGLLNALANTKKLPEPALYQPLVDLAELNAARLLYMADRYVEALQKTKQILKKFPSLPEAFELEAWTQLALKQNSESVKQAFTLRTPTLKNYFSPQATLIPAIVYLENCDYASAKPHIAYFREKYKTENDYLIRTNADYYSDLISALKRRNSLSPKVVADWIASPSLLALLDENNLLLDEKAIAVELKNSSAQMQLQEVEKNNLALIRTQLAHRSQVLKTNLNEATENAALIQADVLLGFSQQIGRSEDVRKPASISSVVATKSVAKPRWSWERKDITHIESDEIWADEIGNLDVEVNNKCK